MTTGHYPIRRLRRLRQTSAVRQMLEMEPMNFRHVIWPVFVMEGRRRQEPLGSLPGQFRFSVDRLVEILPPMVEQGLGGLLIFGVPPADRKDEKGTAALCANGVVPETVRTLRAYFPNFTIFTDVCLCAYTRHGHCGPLNAKGQVDNEATLELLSQMAVVHAQAGATGVAPSAMMDGQVAWLRRALDETGYTQTLIMSYSTKMASSFYGPFREAAGSTPAQGDRRGYQASYADGRRALLESALDEEEGADILMIKPALAYLDVLARLRDRTDLPLAAFNVSGEYAMVMAAAARGLGDWRDMALEIWIAIARAGAEILITYWANHYAEVVHGRS